MGCRGVPGGGCAEEFAQGPVFFPFPVVTAVSRHPAIQAAFAADEFWRNP
jgi:hypothetical protein